MKFRISLIVTVLLMTCYPTTFLSASQDKITGNKLEGFVAVLETGVR